jgi:hypothetical protein
MGKYTMLDMMRLAYAGSWASPFGLGTYASCVAPDVTSKPYMMQQPNG